MPTKSNNNRAGTLLDSGGPLGVGPQYKKTSGPIGVCDELDPKFLYEDQKIKEKKILIKKMLQRCVDTLSLAIRYTEEKSAIPHWKITIKDFFKVPEDDIKLKQTAKIINSVLRKIRSKITDCDLKIEVKEPGLFTKWAILVRKHIYKNIDETAPVIAEASGDKIILYTPGFFSDGDVGTLIHEFAHLVGIEGDIVYMSEAWDSVKDPEKALKQADAYAYYAIRVANYARNRKMF